MIFILWGEDKSTKNTVAFTFPKPLVDMEFDIGGSRRAIRNLPHAPIKDWYEQGLIKVEQYVMPFQIGSIDPVTGIIRPSKIVTGVKELFYQFATNFLKHLKDDTQTIMVDTGTLLYETTCLGYLQEKQELQLNPDGTMKLGRDGKTQVLRTQLQREEYREPYIRMRGFLYQAKAANKHLVMTHHATDQYGLVKQRDGTLSDGKTGKRELHGWKQLGDGCDVLGHVRWQPRTTTEPGNSWFDVELAEVKELEGMKFKNPTFDMIDTTIKMIRGEL